jgi:hypothetical protein
MKGAYDQLAADLLAPPKLPLQRVFAALDTEKMRKTELALNQLWQGRDTLWTKPPLVSVILPTRERADVLAGAIESVLRQSYPHIELHVIDDGSRDATPHVLKRFDGQICAHHTAGLGVAAARNIGLAAATGDIIAFLDSDNVWTPDHLRNLVMAMALAGAQCAYDMLAIHRAGSSAHFRGEAFDWNECLRGNYIDLNIFAHLRQDQIKFDTDLPRVVDWDYILRVTKGQNVAFAPQIGCDYDDSQTRHNRISLSQPRLFQSICREKNRHNLTVPQIITGRAYRFTLVEGANGGEMAQRLGTALAALGQKADRCGENAALPKQTEVVIYTSADRPHMPSLQVVSGLILPEIIARYTYAALDGFDILLCQTAAQAAHLTAVLRRPVYQISGLQSADMAAHSAQTLLGALHRSLMQPRRKRSFAPSPALIGRARVKLGLLAQRGRNWPNASSFLRLICPLTTPHALKQVELVELNSPADPRMDACSTVIVQRFALPNLDSAAELADRLQSRHKRLIVDCDDHPAAIGPDDPRSHALLWLMGRAGHVTLASPALRDLHGHLGAALVPNRLDPRIWQGGLRPPAPPRADQPLRIVYFGTPTHDADFVPVYQALNCLWASYQGRFDVTIIGALRKAPEAAWFNPAGASVPQTAYPDFCQRALRLGAFHLGIAPLNKSPLNDVKSDIKCLDHAALGAVTLVSDAPPYTDLVKASLALQGGSTENSWYDALESALRDPDMVHARAQATYDWLWSQRSWAKDGDIDTLLATILTDAP